MRPLCELEKQGIELGKGYKNNQTCATFVEYIVLGQCQALADALLSTRR